MRYQVVGNHTQDGVEPGGIVEIDDPVRARRLVRAGHIAPANLCGCGRTFGSARGLATHQRSCEEA